MNVQDCIADLEGMIERSRDNLDTQMSIRAYLDRLAREAALDSHTDRALVPLVSKCLQMDAPGLPGVAARLLADLEARETCRDIVQAFDTSYQTFKNRPAENEMWVCIGNYRDKVQALTEAIWRLGFQEGMSVAKQRLEECRRLVDLNPSLDAADRFLIAHIETMPYDPGWRQMAYSWRGTRQEKPKSNLIGSLIRKVFGR